MLQTGVYFGERMLQHGILVWNVAAVFLCSLINITRTSSNACVSISISLGTHEGMEQTSCSGELLSLLCLVFLFGFNSNVTHHLVVVCVMPALIPGVPSIQYTRKFAVASRFTELPKLFENVWFLLVAKKLLWRFRNLTLCRAKPGALFTFS